MGNIRYVMRIQKQSRGYRFGRVAEYWKTNPQPSDEMIAGFLQDNGVRSSFIKASLKDGESRTRLYGQLKYFGAL